MVHCLTPEKVVARIPLAPVLASALLCAAGLTFGCEAPQPVNRAFTDDGSVSSVSAPPEPDARPPAEPAPPPRACGNGSLDPGEECDLGGENRVGGYGPDVCLLNCTRAASCGDGKVNGEEECDDGPENSESDGRYGQAGQCNLSCRKITQYCGDEVVTAPETCDKGMLNSDAAYGPDTCTASCQVAPFCGDAKPHMREECDEGPANALTDKIWSLNGGGCNMLCRKIVQRCGDGMANMPDEDCDAGMMNTGNDMVYGPGPACNRICKKVSYCGDGFRDAVEHCDLGMRNTNNDKVWGITPGGCNRACGVIYRYCGDGYLEVGDEQCDLGPGRNTGANTGCDARCRIVNP